MSLDNPRKNFPDFGSLIAYMDRARENHDEELREQYVETYERAHGFSDGWYTNIPLLAAVVATSQPGPILEVGVGRGSSSLLVELCKAMGRELVGVDNDAAWLTKMADLEYPELVHIPDWNQFPSWLASRGKWSVAFIDHGPGEARLPVLKMVRPCADQIVAHDVFNPGYLIGFDDELATFKFKTDYTLMPSCSSVVSDVRPYAGAR
jgi:hypothetical protein